MLYKICLTCLFQVGQNWLTWNTDRPQRALKQGLVYQVNVRNAIFTFKCSQRERNGLFCPVAHKKQLFLRADSKRVAQLTWLGVRYNGGRARHRPAE